jgi:hypothetical protein
VAAVFAALIEEICVMRNAIYSKFFMVTAACGVSLALGACSAQNETKSDAAEAPPKEPSIVTSPVLEGCLGDHVRQKSPTYICETASESKIVVTILQGNKLNVSEECSINLPYAYLRSSSEGIVFRDAQKRDSAADVVLKKSGGTLKKLKIGRGAWLSCVKI